MSYVNSGPACPELVTPLYGALLLDVPRRAKLAAKARERKISMSQLVRDLIDEL